MRMPNTSYNSYIMHSQRNKILSYVAVGTLSFISGCMFQSQGEDVTIRNGMIEYKNLSRPISIQSDRIIVGTVKERLEDLLLESPGVIKKTTEDILEKMH